MCWRTDSSRARPSPTAAVTFRTRIRDRRELSRHSRKQTLAHDKSATAARVEWKISPARRCATNRDLSRGRCAKKKKNLQRRRFYYANNHDRDEPKRREENSTTRLQRLKNWFPLRVDSRSAFWILRETETWRWRPTLHELVRYFIPTMAGARVRVN